MSYSIRRSTPESTGGLTVAAILVVVLVTLPWWNSGGSLQTTLVMVLLYLALAQMWNLLAGFTGLISIGQQMFVGIGAYGLLTLAESNGIDPWISVPLSGVVAALVSIPVAAFAFRLDGGYFAIGTWVVAEVVRLLVNENGSLRGGEVRALTRNALGGYSKDTRADITYWLALALAVGGTAIVVFVLRSRIGLSLRAMRDNASGARGLGISITRTKLLVWVISALWTGCVGAVILLNSPSTTSTSAFSVLNWTALVIFIVVIGGVGSTTGPIIGVLFYWFLNETLSGQETWRFIILGAIAAVMAVAAPKGVYGLLQRWRPIQFFPVRRRLVGPDVD